MMRRTAVRGFSERQYVVHGRNSRGSLGEAFTYFFGCIDAGEERARLHRAGPPNIGSVHVDQIGAGELEARALDHIGLHYEVMNVLGL